MPDITKCSNKNCKLNKTCYRYIVKSSGYQSYADFEPVKNKCDYYMKHITKRFIESLKLKKLIEHGV